MRYIDSGERSRDQALGRWFSALESVTELRLQTGFFDANALRILDEVLSELRERDGTTNVLIGANDRTTVGTDVVELLEVVGVPRENAQVGVVSFDGAYFHPKVVHVRRSDGTSAAYVGSANLTSAGVQGLNVEAGMILDNGNGDSTEVLDRVASSVDRWFLKERAGLIRVDSHEAIEELIEGGILRRNRSTRPRGGDEDGRGDRERRKKPRLKPLIHLPKSGRATVGSAVNRGQGTGVEGGLPSAPRAGFPPYIRFAPDANGPTRGSQALTGAPLPDRSVGLIVKLSQVTTKPFYGGKGTTDMPIPVETAPTIRFGIKKKGLQRPRAEFVLKMRLVGDAGSVSVADKASNIMGYGLMPQERTHKEIRMLVPRGQARKLGQRAAALGVETPTAGDYALLVWPTPESPRFKLSFLAPGSRIAAAAESIYQAAEERGRMIGRSSCALPTGLDPEWRD